MTTASSKNCLQTAIVGQRYAFLPTHSILYVKNYIPLGILKKQTMLTLRQIRDQKEDTIHRLTKRGIQAEDIVNHIIELDNVRRASQQEMDASLAEQNSIAKEIGLLFKNGKREEAEKMKQRASELKEQSQELEKKMAEAIRQLEEKLVELPNVPAEIVPEGRTPEDNVVVKEGGEIPALSDAMLPHWDLCKQYDIVDFELGVKITGAGFPVYKGKGARIQRALINYFVDFNAGAGYQEILPPLVVNADSGFGTGQLPDKEGQMYHVTVDDLYMIPTGEVPATNIFRDVIVDEAQLPIRLTAYTPCFRREAGSYGKDVRGLNRLHQFDKVEIVEVSHPEKSYERLDAMVAHVEALVKSLGLPYRILRLCGGDMGFTSALTYDFEVYSAAQKRWLEVSSVSNFETFQTNRLKLRYRDAESREIKLAHTLNGSSLALPRILAALLENNQTESGIKIPEVLHKYCGFDMI